MKTVTNKTKPKTVSELIHDWCNNRIEKDINKGAYTFEPTKFYVKGSLKAIIVNKKYFIIKSFSNIGSYGQGLSDWQLKNAVPDTYFSIIVKELPNFDAEYPETLVKYLQQEFIIWTNSIFRHYSYLKQIATNTWTKNIPALTDLNFTFNDEVTNYYSRQGNRLFIKYLKLFPKDVVKQFYKTKITHKYCLEKYNGWGRNAVDRYYETITFTPRQVINNKLIKNFTKEELDIINFKNWRDEYDVYTDNKYKNQYVHNLKDAKELYFDVERRKQHEVRYELRKKEAILATKQKEAKEFIDKLKKLPKNKEAFRSGGKDFGLLRFDYPILKMTLSHPQEVLTSMGVTISLEEAKKAFNLFLKFKDKPYKGGDTVDTWKVIGIKEVEVPTLDATEETIVYKKEKALVIGCHRLLESEIFDFINYYKLDWIKN